MAALEQHIYAGTAHCSSAWLRSGRTDPGLQCDTSNVTALGTCWDKNSEQYPCIGAMPGAIAVKWTSA